MTVRLASTVAGRPIFVALLLHLLAPCAPALAGADCAPLDGAGAARQGAWVPREGGDWKTLPLPSGGDVDHALADLDYGDELPRAYALHLNGAGRQALLLGSPGGRLCGNGGCPYVLLSAGALRRIGTFFGELGVLDAEVNGYRLIQAYSHSASGATLATYAYDRGRYRLTSRSPADACAVARWRRGLRTPASAAGQ